MAAQSKSLNEAAQKLYITRQSINTAITNLEKELNLKIFDRGRTGVSLTEDGLKVVQAAQNILNTIDQLKALHSDTALTQTFIDSLNIYVVPVMNFYFSQLIHSALFKANIHLHLQTINTDRHLKMLADNKLFDGVYFLVIFDQKKIAPFSNNTAFMCSPLVKDHLVVILSPQHALARYKSISVASLLKYPLAAFQTNEQTDCPYRYIFPQNAEPNINICTDNIFAYIDAIKNGISISPISAFTYQHSALLSQDPQITCIHLKPTVNFTIYSLCTRDYYQQHSASLDLLFAMLKEASTEKT